MMLRETSSKSVREVYHAGALRLTAGLQSWHGCTHSFDSALQSRSYEQGKRFNIVQQNCAVAGQRWPGSTKLTHVNYFGGSQRSAFCNSILFEIVQVHGHRNSCASGGGYQKTSTLLVGLPWLELVDVDLRSFHRSPRHSSTSALFVHIARLFLRLAPCVSKGA